MKIDIIDMGDQNMAAHDEALVKNYSDQIFHMNPTICNALHDMVDKVVNFVSASGQINILRFWGHGYNEMQRISSNQSGDDSVGDNNAFWSETVWKNAYYLQKLTPLFATDGIIELHGSRIASGTDGEIFLIKIAAAVNVPVVGQDKIQGGADSKISIGNNIAWEAGLVTMGWPDYSITYGPGSTL